MKIEKIYKALPTNKDCIKLLEILIWDNLPVCPYCNSQYFTESKSENRYHCNTCNISYSVTVKTFLHNTKIELQKWFYVVILLSKNDPMPSSRTLGKDIGTTKDTALRIMKAAKQAYIKERILIEKILNYFES
ncbi:MAG: transposase [Chitinophagaceae bacterium]|mgnify:FL=1|nr:transposase [Chitinophagaceae bacterium]